jgi:guanyl-specific ribonuclease Sa
MKYTKAASVLAVTMVAVGSAASVAAAQTAQSGAGMPTSPSMSLNSGVQQLVDAYNAHTKPLDGPVPLVNSAKDVAKKLNDTRNAEPMKLVEGAVRPAAGSMLGGLPVGR